MEIDLLSKKTALTILYCFKRSPWRCEIDIVNFDNDRTIIHFGNRNHLVLSDSVEHIEHEICDMLDEHGFRYSTSGNNRSRMISIEYPTIEGL